MISDAEAFLLTPKTLYGSLVAYLAALAWKGCWTHVLVYSKKFQDRVWGLTLEQEGVVDNFRLAGRRCVEEVFLSYCAQENVLVCALRMTHRLWHGIDVDVHIERIGIAVLGARLWATQLMIVTKSLRCLLRPPQILPQL